MRRHDAQPTWLSRRQALTGLVLAAAGCRRGAAGSDRPLVLAFGPRYAPANPEVLRAALEQRSKLKLELRVAKTGDELVDLVQAGTADAALSSLFDFMFCHGAFDVEPLVQLVRGGHLAHAGELVVKEDSAVRALDGLRGQRVGYVDRYSVTGFLLPAATFGEARIEVEPVFLGSHDAVLEAVKAGQVAAGASYAGHGAAHSGLRALSVSAQVANEPLFIQRRVPAEARQALREALIALDDPKALAGLADGTGFAAVNEHAWEQSLALLKAAGLRVEDTLPGGWLRANDHRRPAWSYGP
jgi:ABC-type phosphate/phosphonate transport system substrate-binding protein